MSNSVPPLIMLLVQRDERLYHPAYDDYSDLDGDGVWETTYKHSVNYYGYFDPSKCYVYQNSEFEPYAVTTDKYCTNGWSGNFLNWVSMSRMDVMRKVLYGGLRSTDGNSQSDTVLERAFLPQDAHGWAKVYTGSDINKLTPYTPSSGSISICNTTVGAAGNPPSLRVVNGAYYRWASVERWQCAYIGEHGNDNNADNYRPATTSRLGSADFIARVKVAVPSLVGTERYKVYPSGNYKPIGLLQQYGDSSKMYFGLITGSYQKNKSGGVLRSKMTDVGDTNSGDINRSTGCFTGANGGIIKTINNLEIIRYNYSDGTYNTTDSCSWGLQSFTDGSCSNWGNPIGEMYYEAMRYFAGKSGATDAYSFSGADYISSLKKETWNSQVDPYSYNPTCAKPFILMLSDVNPSYDSDQLPGSYFGSFSGDISGLDVQTWADKIGDNEGLGSGTYFVGQSGTSADYECTAKSIPHLGQVRGICPDAPSREGSYYLSALAYYAHNNAIRTDKNIPKITTYSVALSSGAPTVDVNIGGSTVKIIPACYDASLSRSCTLVNFRVISKTATSGEFYVNWEDSLQGGDYDMDADGRMFYTVTGNTINVQTRVENSSTGYDLRVGYVISGTTNDGLYLEANNGSAWGVYSSCTTFSGHTCGGSTCTSCASRDHNVGASTAQLLHDPLWYASKYGGFTDSNGSGKPDQQSKWDSNNDGVPDTYFYASNALLLEQKIIAALNDILRRAGSGTTVVSLPPSQSRESYIIAQSYFYPERIDGNTTINWIGYLRALWADVVGNIRENSDTASETSVLKYLDTKLDKIIAFVFSSSDQDYVAKVFTDTNGDSTPDSCSTTQKGLDDVAAVWEAAPLLKSMSPADRTIKTWVDSDGDGVVDTGEFVDFSTGLSSSLMNYWSYGDMGSCNDNCAQSVIKYIRGYDLPSPSGADFRLRQGDSTTGSDVTSTWKLGDIMFSTPKISSNKAVNGYASRYADSTYKAFTDSTRISGAISLAIMGANDGMVHAFRVGKLEDINPPTTNGGGNQIGKLSTPSGKLGAEEWAFIPRNVIPYLRWYCSEDYCHIPMADTTFTIVDASIGDSSTSAGSSRTVSSWRRLLVGAMGFGGTPITIGGTTFSSSVFVLDITPDEFGNISAPTLLWEKKLPDNTLTTGTPGIVRLGAKGNNGSWYVVIGSGPASIATGSVTYTASPKIFVFNLKDGSEVTGGGISVTGASNSAIGDITVTDFDSDYQTDDIYFGAYTGTNTGQDGQLYRLRIRDGDNTDGSGKYLTSPSGWVLSVAVNAGRPVFASPAMSMDAKNNIWMYFGTGLYLTTEHITSTDELFYGFKETTACWKDGGTDCPTTAGYTSFLDTTGLTLSGAKATSVACQCDGGVVASTGYCSPPGTCSSCPSGTSVITGVSGATLGGGTTCSGQSDDAAISCLEDLMDSYGGWKVSVTNAKIYASPLVFGGIVSSTLFTPTTDVCQFGGTSGVMALNYTTGTAYIQPAIMAQGGTTGTSSSAGIARSVQVGVGAPPFKQSLVPIATGDTYKVFTQASGGIAGLSINPSVDYQKDRFVQWLTK